MTGVPSPPEPTLEGVKFKPYLFVLGLAFASVIVVVGLEWRQGEMDAFERIALPALIPWLFLLGVYLWRTRRFHHVEKAAYATGVVYLLTRVLTAAFFPDLPADPLSDLAEFSEWFPTLYVLGFLLFSAPTAVRVNLVVYTMIFGISLAVFLQPGRLGDPAGELQILVHQTAAGGVLLALLYAFARIKDAYIAARAETARLTEARRVILERTAQLEAANEALDRALTESTLLNDVITAATGEDDLARLLSASLRHLGRAIRFTGGSVALVEGEDLVIRAAAGRFAENALGQRLRRGTGRSWQVIETTEPFLSNDLQAEGFKPKSPVRSHLAVPLLRRGRAFGLLEVDSVEINAFTQTDLQLVQRVAAALSGPIELAKRERELRDSNTFLQQAREEAERASRAKSDFLSRMSHELRTPLNAILGFAQLLEMNAQTPESREDVEQIIRGGQHLLGLINEVLDIARIEAGRLPVSPEPVRVREVVDESFRLVSPLADDRNVSLRWDEATPQDAEVMADRQRVKQVMLNLLSNGVKYNRAGGTVTVSCRQTAPGWVRIGVTDTGPGIPAERMERLFLPFERLGLERSGEEGAGIGLAISKGLVELMGGAIGVESALGIGSTFWVDLPLTGRGAGEGTPTAQRHGAPALRHGR